MKTPPGEQVHLETPAPVAEQAAVLAEPDGAVLVVAEIGEGGRQGHGGALERGGSGGPGPVDHGLEVEAGRLLRRGGAQNGRQAGAEQAG